MNKQATELAREYRSGGLKPTELVGDLLQRIDELNPKLNAFTQVFHGPAMAAAREAENAFSRGEDKGPMQGIPVGIKDLATTVEGPTSAGTTFLGGYLERQDAPLVTMLRKQGVVILGKTTMTEGAFSVHHPDVPVPVSPWAPQHWAGVSSSGSGVALAAGLCPLALGTDTGGSIRLPSSCNHLVGLKPTYGAISDEGTVPLASSLDHPGPMARSVQDCTMMFAAMSGREIPMVDGYSTARIGVDFKRLQEHCSVPIRQLLEQVMDEYRQLGFQLVDLSLPDSQASLAAGWIMTTAAEAAAYHATYLKKYKGEYGPGFSFLLQLAEQVEEGTLAELERSRQDFTKALDELFYGVDALLCPVMPGPAMTLAEMAGRQPSPEDIAQSMLYTAPFNYSGHPCLTLPAGFAGGAPSGYQLVGARDNESALLDIAHDHESLKNWAADVPDLSWIGAA